MKNILLRTKRFTSSLIIATLVLAQLSFLPTNTFAADGEDITISDGGTTVWNTDKEYDDIIISGGSTVGLTGTGRTLTFDTLTITGNSTLACNSCTLSADADALGNITIDSGSQITGSGMGDAGGDSATTGDGTGGGTGTANGGGGGGAHGGNGGTGVKNTVGTTTGGTSYGTSQSLTTIGSGGGGGSTGVGGDGGGLIIFDLRNGTERSLTVNGSITSNGTDGEDGDGPGGGGAGGSIRIIASTVSGSGTITAIGGTGGTDTNDGDDNAGGGGGGRIELYFTIDSQSTYNLLSLPTTMVAGGAAGGGTATAGSTGSVYSESLPYTNTPAFVSQATDGTGYVTFNVTVYEQGSDTTTMTVAYSTDGGTTYHDPYLVSATPDSGTVNLDNAQSVQIGASDPIDTNTGSRTLTIVWDTKSASNSNGAILAEETDVKIRILVQDDIGTNGPRGYSANFSVDNLGPQTLSGFGVSRNSSSYLTFSWTAATTETNFDHYEIWYGTSSSDVTNRTGTATEWDNSDQVNLGTLTTASATTTFDASSPGNLYYGKLWGVDDYGNESTLAIGEFSTGTMGSSSSSSSSSSSTTEDEEEEEETSESEIVEEATVSDTTTSETETTSTDATDTETSPSTEVSGTTVGASTTGEGTTVLEVNEELITGLDRNLDRFDRNLRWSTQYFKTLLETNHVQEGISNSEFLRSLVQEYIDAPEGTVRGQDAITLAMFISDDSIFTKAPSTTSAITSVPFVNLAFSSRVLHSSIDTIYDLEEPLTRAQAIQIVARIVGVHPKLTFDASPLESYGLKFNPFTDIDMSAPYASYALYLYKEGVLSGNEEKALRPDDAVNRSDFVKILTKVMELKN